MRVDHGFTALTEKEKQTLRLIVRGHDAKSTARALGLSVHTINERLRDARRKLAVTTSREAARLLLETEGGSVAPHPEKFGDTRIGEDAARGREETEATPTVGVGRAYRPGPMMIGGVLVTIVLGLLALTLSTQTGSVPTGSPPPQAPAASSEVPSAEVVESARRFLMLVDEGRWDESYRLFGKSFQRINTARVWAETSEKVRVPLGRPLSRTFLSQENLPAPPNGYEVVKFRTAFAGKPNAVETVSLDREAGRWVVVGVMIN